MSFSIQFIAVSTLLSLIFVFVAHGGGVQWSYDRNEQNNKEINK